MKQIFYSFTPIMLATLLVMGCTAKQAKIDFGPSPTIAPPETWRPLEPIIVGDPEEEKPQECN